MVHAIETRGLFIFPSPKRHFSPASPSKFLDMACPHGQFPVFTQARVTGSHFGGRRRSLHSRNISAHFAADGIPTSRTAIRCRRRHATCTLHFCGSRLYWDTDLGEKGGGVVERPQDESGASVLLIPCCSFVWDSSAFWQGGYTVFFFLIGHLVCAWMVPFLNSSLFGPGYPLGYFCFG